NGMKVSINLEYSMDTEKGVAVPFGTRQEMLALSGDFGKISSGYLQTTAYYFNVKFDPTYGSAVSPLQSINKGTGSMLDGAARLTQTIAYATPKMGPFSAEVNYSTGNADAGNAGLPSGATAGLKTTVTLLSGIYADGPLTVQAVYGKTASDNAVFTSTTETILGASYDLGVAKIMGTYASNKATVTNSLFSLSGVIPMGSGSVVASYSANSMNTANTGAKGFMAGYTQNLSKSTTAYVAFENVKNDSATSGYSVMSNGVVTSLTAGGSSSLLIAGLRKKF
ncbi:MAG: porin, partial [Sideroxydans sp.]